MSQTIPLRKRLPLIEGGPGSGDHGHVGRPGMVGGSGGSGGSVSRMALGDLVQPRVSDDPQFMGILHARAMGNKLIDIASPYYDSSSDVTHFDIAKLEPAYKAAVESEIPLLMEKIPGMPPSLQAVVGVPFNEHDTAAATINPPDSTVNTALLFNSEIPIAGYIADARKTVRETAARQGVPLELVAMNPDWRMNAAAHFNPEDGPKIIVDHELGHVFYNYLSQDKREQFIDAVGASRGGRPALGKISSYATSSVNEAFAEAFAVHVNGADHLMGKPLREWFAANVPYTRKLPEVKLTKLTRESAQSAIKRIDTHVAKLLYNARRGHIVALEIQISQYQRELWRHTQDFLPKIEGAVGNPKHMDTVTTNLVADLEKLGDGYAQTAANLGFERCLRDLQSNGWIQTYTTPVVAPSTLIATALYANHKYLFESLRPDLHAALKAKALRNLPQTLLKFERRIKSYGHYLWRISEQAYREGMNLFFSTASVKAKLKEGGVGSGNYAHAGRPGLVGGSSSSGSTAAGHTQTAQNEVGVIPGEKPPWELNAPAPARYPGDTSIYSPALPDAKTGEYILGRRIQGTALDPNDPHQVSMFSFFPTAQGTEKLAQFEKTMQQFSDHGQLHPGELVRNVDGELQHTAGNAYYIRGNVDDLTKLYDTYKAQGYPAIFMTNKTPGGRDVPRGEDVEHLRVVVPFAEGTPKNTTGPLSIPDSKLHAIQMELSGPEGRMVTVHKDFNGLHIAVSTEPSIVDRLYTRVGELGGRKEVEEHHNAGATRFVPKDINVERYGVKEALAEGGAGSGDHGHVGRPNQVGGSGPSELTDQQHNYFTGFISEWSSSTSYGAAMATRMAVNEWCKHPDDFNLGSHSLEVLKTLEERTKGKEPFANNSFLDNSTPIKTRSDEKALLKEAVPLFQQSNAAEFDKKFPQGTVVYRGVNHDDATAIEKITTGDTLQFDPLISTSYSQDAAHSFWDAHKESDHALVNTMLEIKVTGRDVFTAYDLLASTVKTKGVEYPGDAWSHGREEREVILLGNRTAWKVTGVENTLIYPHKEGSVDIIKRIVKLEPVH